MNRKLLNFILSGALLFGCMGLFSSCKDTSEDQFAELNSELLASDAKLQDQLNKAIDQINDLKSQLGSTTSNLNALIQALQAQIDALKGQVNGLNSCECDPTLQAQIDALKAQLAGLSSCQCDPTLLAQLQALKNRLDAVETLLNECDIEENKELIKNLPELAQKVIDLEAKIDQAGISLDDVFNDPRWKEVLEVLNLDKLKQVLASYQVATIPDAIEKLIKDVANLKAQEIPADLTAELVVLQGDVTNLKEQITNINTTLGEKADLSALEDLGAKVEANKAAIETANDAIKANEDAIKANEDAINALSSDVEANKAAIEAYKAEIEACNQAIEVYKIELNKLNETVDAYKAELVEMIDGINTSLKDKIAAVEANVDSLIENLKEEFKKEIERVEAKVDKNKQDIDKNTTSILKNEGDIKTLFNSVDELKKVLEQITSCNCADEIAKIKKQLEELEPLKETVTSLNKSVAELAKELSNKTANLEDRMNNIINSIVIQQVSNKVFGSIMLPIDLQTNILMAYHGYNDSGISEFPSVRTQYEFNGDKVFTTAELNGVTKVSIRNLLLDESDNNAGNVYFTVNPSNVNLKNSVFSLVNSLDQACGIQLSKPVPCDKLLTYGWSRADNGFYWANAHLSPENVEGLTLSIGKELEKEIGSTAKEFLRDLRNLERPDISQLAASIKNVFQRFNGKLAANAIKGEYQYKDLDGKTVKASTYSNYGIAALTYEPQSFHFLEDQQNVFDKIPTIPTIHDFEFELSKASVNFKRTFTVNDIKINLVLDKITFNDNDITVEGYATSDELDANGEYKKYPITATVEDLQNLADIINAELEKLVGQVNNDVTAQVNAMVKELIAEVDKMLENMSAQVNDQLDALMAEFADQLNDQFMNKAEDINKLIKKVNGLIARVNGVLANPNKYIQPLAIYNANGGQDMHILSTSRVAPSKFYLNGGNATTLYFTSYTLEAIAPSYKKFVKVVNAWKNGDTSRTTVASAVNKANAKGSLNQVINGNHIRFAFAPEAGYTYEIVFQALDYQGYTSTRRCFVEVR